MAQSSLGRVHDVSFGADNECNLDELLSDIDSDIVSLEEILNLVGTASDTIDKRHEFNNLRNRINYKISRATKQITQSLQNVDSNVNNGIKYQKELQKHTHSLRSIVASAIKSFRSNQPHSNVMSEHNEKSPLLSSNNEQSLTSIARSVQIVEERKLMEEEEERMSEIHDDLKNMKAMFENLDDLVNEQEEAVDKLECNVKVVKEAVEAGKDELLIGRRNQSRQRNNRIVLLIVLIIVLAIIIAFVWAYDRTK